LRISRTILACAASACSVQAADDSAQGRIREIIAVNLPRPRSLMIGPQQFGDLFDHIFHVIREEVMKAMEQHAAEGVMAVKNPRRRPCRRPQQFAYTIAVSAGRRRNIELES
jgi:hypothetical protein